MVQNEQITLGEVARALNRIESKLDTELSDHEARLRRLEQWMWGTTGLASAGLFSGLWAWIELVGKG
jgi:hypothetical protein